MKECCNNCSFQYSLVKYDYSKGGCIHTNLDGFLCFATTDPNYDPERKAVWMVGTNGEGMCELYKEKKQ